MKPDKPKPIKKSKSKSAAEYEQQIGELTAHLQRLQAEFENYKKRVGAEKSELMDSAKEAVLSELLPALDNFDRAATHLPEDLQDNSWAKGMQYVGHQLLDILADMGVTKFDPTGQEFDHGEHEAVEFVETDKPEGTVLEVVVPGYMIGGRVVRPAQVKVSSGQHNYQKEEGESDE